jgi:hypothetical protein
MVKINKGAVAIVLAASLFTGTVSYRGAEAQVSFINIDLSNTPNPDDFPFGIECGDPQFVYVTIFDQGLLAKIDKFSGQVVELIDDPDGPVAFGQAFYSIGRDPNTGNLFVNEETHGKAWRFSPYLPQDSAWSRIPMLERIDHPLVSYPFGYDVRPDIVNVDEGASGIATFAFDVSSRGGIVFVNGFIWIGLTYSATFDDFTHDLGIGDKSFSGIVRVDPSTLEVTRFQIPGAGLIASINVDRMESTMIWVVDNTEDKLYKFDTATLQVIQTINLPEGSQPNHLDTDFSKNIFVALNKANLSGEDVDGELFSEIAQIRKDTLDITIINTGAPNFNFGTFTVFVTGDFMELLIWTDQSGHVGTIDLLTGEKTFEVTGEFDSNHFGCIPFDGQFWFASRGSAKVGILPNSRFSVGGPKTPNSGGRREHEDSIGPTIYSYYWDPESPADGNTITINANILDDVSVEKAFVFYYSAEEDERKARSVAMSKFNAEWFTGSIEGTDVKQPVISFWIVASDSGGNSAKSEISTVNVRQGQVSQSRSSVTNLPAHVLEAIGKKIQPVEKLEVTSMKDNDRIRSFTDSIVIRNVGNVPVNNIKVVLSPDIARTFMLGERAIKSIEPHANVTITFELNGSPNRNVLGGLEGYDGYVMIMAEHHSPITLPVSIGALHGADHLTDYMFRVASMATARYSQVSLLNSLVRHTEQNYMVTADGDDAITDPSGEVVIKNISNKELKNVRLYLSNAGHAFLLDQSNIESIAPNSEASVKLIPMIDTQKYSKDINGELLIVPSNDVPMQIPVVIKGAERKDSADEYTVRVESGDAITSASEKITIMNGERTMDSVRIALDSNLNRIFSLSESTFKHIEPYSTVTVELKFNSGDLKTFMQGYEGMLMVMSEHHNMQTVPIKMVWHAVESEHFTIYARSGYEDSAQNVVDALERNYSKVAERFGGIDRTVIYMAGMDEMRSVNRGYSYSDDVIVICSCDSPEFYAMKEFLYRLVINNYASYHNMKQLMFDQENWLIDGVTTYLAVSMGSAKYDTVHANADVSFQWYGRGSDAQYAATFTLFRYLEDTYSDNVIDRILYYLGTGMVSNHRCDTVENCTLLQGVYGAMSMNMNEKKHTKSVKSIVEEWRRYVEMSSMMNHRIADKFAYQIE